MAETSLYDAAGKRLYLSADERLNFLDAAKSAPPKVRTLCETLAYTGCRISEALELSAARIDLDSQRVIVRSLKKRGGKILYRAIPAPPVYFDTLQVVHDLRAEQARGKAEALLWSTPRRMRAESGRKKVLRRPWVRHYAWRLVKQVMQEAKIPPGPHCSPKGLRHAYGVHAIASGAPLNMLSKWMGHADLATTAIYANALGVEETEIAQRMWD